MIATNYIPTFDEVQNDYLINSNYELMKKLINIYYNY